MSRWPSFRQLQRVLLLSACFAPTPCLAQAVPTDSVKVAESSPFALGVDVVSRYVWRGLDLAGAPNLQPYASVSFRGFTLGTWGSYALAGDYVEQDLYLSYTRSTPMGSLTGTLFDYYAFDRDDGPRPAYFDLRGVVGGTAEGSHVLEGMLAYTGPERLPVTLALATNLYNDPDHASYLEAAYNPALSRLELGFFAGLTLNRSDYYAADAGRLVSLGASAGLEFTPFGTRTLGASLSVVRHPVPQQTFYVLKLGL